MKIEDIISISNNMKKVKEGQDLPLLVSFLSSGEKSLILYNHQKPCIFVCSDSATMTEVKRNLEALGKSVGVANTSPISPQYFLGQDMQCIYDFISNIFDFALGKTDVLIVFAETLQQPMPDKLYLEKYITFEKNKEYNFSNISKKLSEIGYERKECVTGKGEFSIRGDILDIFPINLEDPIRLDFFGDELEKINFFDLDDMKNIAEIEKIDVYPAIIFDLENIDKNKLILEIKNNLKITKTRPENKNKITEIVDLVCEKIQNNVLENNNFFVASFLENKGNLLNLFEDFFVFYDEPKKIFDFNKLILNNNYERYISLLEKGELLEKHLHCFCDENNIFRKNNYYIFSNFKTDVLPYKNEIAFRNIGSRKYTFDYNALYNDLLVYQKSNYIVVLFCGDENSKKSIGEFLASKGLLWRDDVFRNLNHSQIILSNIYYPSSFSFLEARVVGIGTADLVKRAIKSKSQISQKNKKKVFYLPKIGDYVVHDVHGVGKCVALERLNLNGSEKDYFVIEYKGGDKFYLPSEQANSISAFLGGEANPTLNKIGGQEFAKAKERVKKSVQTLAVDLVRLYSEREKAKGFVYSSDNYLLDEFENAFAYEETADQLSAIEEIKKDMQSGKVMDRLICGDVGYGKTEIALRAAYQAVIDGKQVCFIAPTTILSEQHYQTAKQRTKDFMCNVGVLNRFRDKAQQTQILKQLKNGEIDIICGTHRLLSNDVVFKDLGLLILDEEQRFGVADKEKIKEMKKDICVLSLSATPIPRTLNMALTGIRDISIIETPPKNRIPIQTYVTQYSDALVEDACKRELSRGGQVLVVHNRVESIYSVFENIKNLLPSARVGVAHGQMPKKILEDTIMKLYEGEYDILVATTLIESGIDLPMANTLIVLDSDRLGLAQLYQLRGRIGRSDRLAYAYFTYNADKLLTQDAYRRLDAIMEFSELGSGFKIAMRDLEIRGAGNVLGKEQHGHMEKVGYDMYCKLLAEAVKELKGEKQKEQRPVKVDVVCPAYIPEGYIDDEEEKIKIYSQISEVKTADDIKILSNQIEQAFGDLPNVVLNLMIVARIKNLCQAVGVKRVFVNQDTSKLYFYDISIFEKLPKNMEVAGAELVLKTEDVPIISIEKANINLKSRLELVASFLSSCLNA
ncbi:MAG: transcription-repair coupling factor [Clostridia bacterium]|nr:transcription-repair coupling factor [Clostridia bacterium]